MGGGGGAGPTVTCPPPSMRPIRHGEYPRRVGGGRAPETPHSRRRQTLSPRPGRRPPPPPPSYTVPVAHLALPRQSAEWAERGRRHRAARGIRRGGKSRARGFRGRGWRGWFASVGSPSSSVVKRPNSICEQRRCGGHADMQDRWKEHRRYVGPPEGGGRCRVVFLE